MQKGVYSISKVNKDEKLKGVGYLVEGNLLIPSTSQKGNAYIRVFEDVAEKCKAVANSDKGRKSVEKIVGLSLDIFSMFFLYQGFYPTIESIKCNGIEHNINLSGKFFTSNQFKKIEHGLIEINEKTLCDEVYKKFEALRGNYLYSFEYLFSTDYEKIVTNHKIMLLLHCLEGCIANTK